MDKSAKKRNILSLILTTLLVLLYIIPNFAGAVRLYMQTDKSSYYQNEVILFNISIDIEDGERIPIQNITLRINNTYKSCSFLPNSTFLTSCSNIRIISYYNTGNSSYGSLFGYGYGYGGDIYNSFGYGYGYGTQEGLTGFTGELRYIIEWNIFADHVPAGNYTATFESYAMNGESSYLYSSSEVSFSIQAVHAVSSVPVILATIPNMTTYEDTQLSFNLSSYEFDNESSGTGLNWSIRNVNSTLFTAYINKTADLLYITPVENAYGNDTFILILTDESLLTASQEVTLAVLPVNDAPSLGNLPDKNIDEDETPLQNWIDLNTFASDVESNDSSLAYTLSGQTNNSLINCSIVQDRYVNCSAPSSDAQGYSDISVRVSDSQNTSEDTFRVTVSSVNDAPVMSIIPGQTGYEDITFALNTTSYISDIEGNELRVFTNSSHAIVVGKIIYFNYGEGILSESVKITASDNLLETSQAVQINITPVNDVPTTPIITVTPKSPATTDNLICNITTASTDPEGLAVTYTFNWYKDGSLQSLQTTNSTSATYVVLAANLTGINQVWLCNVTASDGTNISSSAIDMVKIGNSAPSKPSLVDVTPNVAYTNDTLTCTASGSTDDGNFSYTYTWLKNSELQPQLTADTVASSYTSKGETWKCVARAYDNYSYSEGAYDTVTILNSKPSIASALPASNPAISETGTQQFNITKSDIDNDTLAVSWYVDGVLVASLDSYAYTATYDSAGTHSVRAVVSDGLATTSHTWTLTVTNVNRAPVLSSIGSQALKENELFTMFVTATDSDEDDSIYYYDNTSLFSINRATGLISFTPNYTSSGSYSVRIRAIDSKGAYDEEVVTFTITNVNQMPQLSYIGSLTAIENTSFSYQVSATDADINERETLAYSDNSSLFNISSSGLISFTPQAGQAGNYSVLITVSDINGAAGEEALSLIIFSAGDSNDEPVLSTYPAESSISLVEGSYQYFNITATDADGTTPSIRWVLDESQVSFGNADNNNAYNYTPGYLAAGTHTLTVNISDGLASAAHIWIINVSNTNRVPGIIAPSAKTCAEDSLCTINILASDLDSDNTLVYFDNTSLFDIGLKTGAIQLTPANSAVGVHSVKVWVADGTAKNESAIQINITDVNDAPVLNFIGSQTTLEETQKVIIVSASDVDAGDIITYSDNTDLFNINASTGVIVFTPTSRQSGTYPITITATDIQGASDSENLVLTVLDINHAPEITGVSPSQNITISEENSSAFTVNATDSDSTELSYLWYLDSSLLSELSGTYTFAGNFTDAGSNAGNHRVTVVVSDGISSDSYSWNLNVLRTKDSDRDSIPDYRDNCRFMYDQSNDAALCSSNLDGDDIDDTFDYVLGDSDHISTNIDNLAITIADATDLNQMFNGTLAVEFSTTEYNSSTGAATAIPIVSVDAYEFGNATTLDLSNITIEKQTLSGAGSLLITGIDLSSLGKTKSAYIDDLSDAKDTICIKDAEVAFISEITASCDAEEETIVHCPGSISSYTCSIVGARYLVSGLSHSAVLEITEPAGNSGTSRPVTQTTTASGSGSASGSISGYVCAEKWDCNNWSDCSSSGMQTRICTDRNSCSTQKQKPAEQKPCTFVEETANVPSGEACTEDWVCDEWSACIAGYISRNCYDLNSCGTLKYKPVEMESCTEEIVKQKTLPQVTSAPSAKASASVSNSAADTAGATGFAIYGIKPTKAGAILVWLFVIIITGLFVKMYALPRIKKRL